MIIGVLSDAHGNARGLERCLDVLQRSKPEQIYFLGDAVGYLPDAEGVLHLLASSGALCIRGNHEEMVLGNLPFTDAEDDVYRLSEARSRISPRWMASIAEWPLRREVVADGVRLLMVHGSPTDPIGGHLYPDGNLTPLRDVPHDVVLVGQTHRPFDAMSGAVRVVNVGSCGMPRDVGNLASCAIYDTCARRCEILRVAFDAERLIGEFGARIHDSVAACLRRPKTSETVGRIVDE